MGKIGLVGHTGFVGANLCAQMEAIDTVYNSKSIDQIIGKRFDVLLISGIRAEKYVANQDPEGDWRSISDLIECLSSVQARKVVHVSTVDVYGNPRSVDESSPADFDNLSAYGANRLKAENEILRIFDDVSIVRLPALFGTGLKKNVLFDLLNEHRLEFINKEAEFQWYPLARIGQDVYKILEKNMKIVNLATQPMKTSSIIERFFPSLDIPSDAVSNTSRYDVRTKFFREFGGLKTGYIMNNDDVLREMEKWLEKI